MPEYRRYGSRDDVIAKDGDYGFVGFNNRLRPDQLTKGTLADAQSVRLDRNGEAQVRKGIELIEAPFAVGGDVLRLPTSEEIGTDVTRLPTTIRSASLTSNIASIVIDDPAVEPGYDFQSGDEVTVEGISFGVGETDPNGTFILLSVTDVGTTSTLTYTLTGNNVASYGVAIVLPQVLNFTLNGLTTNPVIGSKMIFDIGQVTEVYASTAFSDPNSSSSESIIIASNLKAVAKDLESNVVTDIYYPLGETVPPLSDMIQAFNKVFIFRDGNTALEWDGIYTSLAVTDLVVDGTYSITDLGTTTQAEWNTIAGTTAVTYAVNDPITVDAVGTGTGTARSAFTLVKSGTYTQPVEINCLPGQFAITNSIASVAGSHDVKVGDDITVMSASISGATGADSGLTVGQDYVVNKVFTLGSAITTITLAVNNGLEGPGDFEGLYKYTLTTAIAHNLVNGEPIIMDLWVDDVPSKGTFFNRSFFVQGVPSSTTFTIYAEFDTTITPATYLNARVAINAGFQFVLDSRTVTTHVNDGASLVTDPIFTKRVSVGLGFTHMPAPPYATYHQRRLVMPFKYSVDATKGQYTYRKILDEVIISDIIDSDTYDEIYSQYRFNAGTADYTVGLHSFSDNSLLVFNRNSIHTVQNTVNLQGSVAKLLTNEVGCVARKSIIQVGNQVIFLSDNGVYGTQFLDEYNLRGTETPMSEAINETINRINRNHWEESRAVYLDNRYYIAVPLDCTVNGVLVEAQRNNAILIFNFLNAQWESIDMVADETGGVNKEWDIENLIVAGNGSARGVYAINQLGGIHKLDTRLDGRDRVVTSIGQPATTHSVPASITTRQYTLGAMDRKNWKQFEMHVESSSTNTSNFDISAETENPDSDIPLQSLSDYISGDSLPAGEDVSIRARIGNRRGYGIQYTINNTQGRPKIRAIETNGSISFRSTQSAE
jgi:hypothetical protein